MKKNPRAGRGSVLERIERCGLAVRLPKPQTNGRGVLLCSITGYPVYSGFASECLLFAETIYGPLVHGDDKGRLPCV